MVAKARVALSRKLKRSKPCIFPPTKHIADRAGLRLFGNTLRVSRDQAAGGGRTKFGAEGREVQGTDRSIKATGWVMIMGIKTAIEVLSFAFGVEQIEQVCRGAFSVSG